jgi:hypothetical protein
MRLYVTWKQPEMHERSRKWAAFGGKREVIE